MSKKMKRVAFDQKVYDQVDDVKVARLKHQTLVHDFMDLQQETEVARNNLMALKQKKLTLQAEVRFLRQRHKFLLSNKSSTLQQQVFVKPQLSQFRKGKTEKVHYGQQTTVGNLPPIDKKNARHSIPSSPEFDMSIGNSLHGVKQQLAQRVIANQRVRVNGPKASPFLNLGQKEELFGLQTRKPIIDLNMISREEEELQKRYQQYTDVQFNPFQNVTSGSGSSGRAGKRKISWQDPVAF